MPSIHVYVRRSELDALNECKELFRQRGLLSKRASTSEIIRFAVKGLVEGIREWRILREQREQRELELIPEILKCKNVSVIEHDERPASRGKSIVCTV